MVLTRFQWRHGGRQVFLCGSFSSWLEHYQMAVMEGSPMVFQTICDLQLGFHQSSQGSQSINFTQKFTCMGILPKNLLVWGLKGESDLSACVVRASIDAYNSNAILKDAVNNESFGYRFLVDGVWRCDEQQYCVAADHGMVNNVIYVEEPNVFTPVPHYDPYVAGTMHINDGIALYMASPRYMPPGTLILISNAETQASRSWISNLLSNQTIYDILPDSSKVFAVGAQLPVKQAFHIMYEEGLAVVPIWDDCRATITGMLTASDFILILRELQNNVRMLANEELEMHPVSGWKEGKFQLYRQCNGPVGLNLRPLIHVSDQECLRDVALKILQNEISAVPIFRSVLPDSSCLPLLNVASLPVILKYIYCRFGEVVGSVPFLHHPICRIPVGTWLPEMGRDSGHHLAVLRLNAPFSSALDFLLKARISSIPIVDDSGALVDVYSRSDIISLAKDDMYARIQLDQINMNQALDLVYQANPQINGRRRCATCFQSTPFFEVIEQLSYPDVRRLVVIDRHSRRVEGVISLRDVAKYFLG